MNFVQPVPFGAPAFAALRQRIAAVQAADPFAPVTVAVSSNYVGLSLRRELARDGLLNVRFQVLARVVELLGAPRLAEAGRTPLTPALKAEAIRRALHDAPGVFEPVASHPGTVRALESTFADLRELPPDTLAALEQQSPRAASLVALYRAFREATARFYDHTDLAEAATLAVEGGDLSALRDIGHLVLYLPRRLAPSEARFVAALGKRGHATVLVGVAGDPEADREAARMAWLLGAALEPVELPVPRADRLVTVPDLEEEVRYVIRDLLARPPASGSFTRTAILFPQAEPYTRIVHEQLRAAGIPATGPSPRTLADSLAGRHLLRLLALPERDLRRDDVMTWLASAPVRNGTSEVPAPRWDELSREAGVVGGAGQWRMRLERLAQEKESKAREERDAGQDWLAERFEGEASAARALARFITELATRLDPGGRATWPELADWALGLQRHYLGEAAGLEWDEAELEPAARVEELLEGLRGLDTFGLRVTLADLRQALDTLLSAPAGRAGPFGQGVFVADLAAASGMQLERVYILGMVEGRLPVRGHEDPLLPDAERTAAGVGLRERPHEQRQEFLAAMASAPERLLLYPQANLRGQRALLPSRWLTEAASLRAGEPIQTSDFLSLPESDWFTQVHSFEYGVKHGPEFATAQERRMRRLSLPPHDARHRAVLDGHPALAAGLEASRARMSDRLTAWDGFVGKREGLLPSAERPTSPTSLEDWATCPMRYYLKTVLRVAEAHRPEDDLQISALERGNLIHKALEEFFREFGDRDPGEPWREPEREALRRIGERLCDEAEAKGLVGKPLLWRAEKTRILRNLEGFLAADEERRSTRNARFHEAEFAFGTRDAVYPAVTVELPDGRRATFRGRIDRVDRHEDGGFSVYDYKSGKADRYRAIESPVTRTGEGRLLQLPAYALAVRQALGTPATKIHVGYWFVSEQEQFAVKGYDLDEAALAQFVEALTHIFAGIESGLFAANPGPTDRHSFENCMWCPYDQLCSADRLRAWERKQDDPAFIPLHALSGGGE